ncbi:AfsR/SARP family transcriptional regulator [Nonomuraea insulae]|uniref:BTAD domain-containing putative transcriptional regulator n=1 Tax=Nonomuraea insulae TaxID=1616787 RepID=A0ABW1CT56_9ACTN
MTLSVLGSLEIYIGGRKIALTPQRRALLATLAIEANHVVSIDRLLDEIWGEAPSQTAAGRVRTLVSDVRMALGAVGPKVIVTRNSGYLLDLEHTELDVTAFTALTQEANLAHSQGRAEAAIELFDEALDLWRGEPLADLRGPLGISETQRLLGVRRAAIEARAEIKLARGQHVDVIAEMTSLAGEYPLSERPHALLMHALHACGRPAEALRTYRDLHSRFVAELGIEPSLQLRELHQKLLADDLVPGPAEWHRGARLWRRLCLLPPDIGDFIGRSAEIKSITAAWKKRASSPAIVAISGFPGVGKTTLALHVAHQSRSRFADGQLYAHLHGASAAPREPAEVLAEMLSSLGVDGAHIPDGAEERAALFRDRIADREVLIVLDDARDEAQVEPLLPGTPNCGILITSRGPLSGLPGTQRVALEVPSEDEACDLLRSAIGQERISREPQAAREILQRCGRLPLAVRIAGARLAARPSWPLRQLAARLSDDSTRLDELVARRMDLRASIQLSYDMLSAADRRAFRLIGVASLDTLTDWSITALLGVPAREADRSVETLVAVGLMTAHDIDAAGQPRYQCHNLIRDFAIDVADETASQQELREAMARLVLAATARVRAATSAMPLPLIPMDLDAMPRTEPSRADRSWLGAERANLTALVLSAARTGNVRAAADLVAWTAPFLLASGHYNEATHMLDAVHLAATHAGDSATGTRMGLLRLQRVEDERVAAGAGRMHVKSGTHRGSEVG